MAEDRPLAEVLFDYLLYAPLGAAVVAAEELPKLAQRGRERFGKQVNAAGLLGRFAVAEARRRLAAQSAARFDSQAGAPQASPTIETASAEQSRPKSSHRAPQRPVTGRGTAQPPAAATTGSLGDELPIPAYDTLAASQVVERLASLTPTELDSVRKHESATRRRRTVLHKIAQLNAERDGVTA